MPTMNQEGTPYTPTPLSLLANIYLPPFLSPLSSSSSSAAGEQGRSGSNRLSLRPTLASPPPEKRKEGNDGDGWTDLGTETTGEKGRG